MTWLPRKFKEIEGFEGAKGLKGTDGYKGTEGLKVESNVIQRDLYINIYTFSGLLSKINRTLLKKFYYLIVGSQET